MSIFGKILVKVMPKKLMHKIVGKQLNKATKVDCGIFAQAAKKKQPQGVIHDFINTHGSTEVSLESLIKQAKTRPVEYSESSFSMAKHQAKKAEAEKPFLERFMEHDKKLNGAFEDTEEMVISEAQVLKDRLASSKGVTTLTPYKGGSKTTEQLLRDGLHQNAEIGPSIPKDLLG